MSDKSFSEREQEAIKLFAKAIIHSPVATVEQKASATRIIHEAQCELRKIRGI